MDLFALDAFETYRKGTIVLRLDLTSQHHCWDDCSFTMHTMDSSEWLQIWAAEVALHESSLHFKGKGSLNITFKPYPYSF